MVIINNKIVLFGGIIEITKESDEVFIFDAAQHKWLTVDLPNPLKDANGSPMNQHKDTESVKGDELTLQHKGSIVTKKLKHTSSLPLLGS
jgi:hypothetical protein